MNEIIVFGYDLLTAGAATLTVSVAGLAIAVSVTVKSRKKLGRALGGLWRKVKGIF